MKVGVLGGGAWGLALARAARRAGSETVLRSRRIRELKGVVVTRELSELASCPLIIMTVPSHSARAVARELGDHLTGAHLLVHAIRGLSGDDLATISQIMLEETPVRRLGALGGPAQASELNDGRASALIVGSAFEEVSAATSRALRSDWLVVHKTADLIGLEWASALVGCLSIGMGYVRAREDVSPGLVAALISRAVDEAARIAAAAGAQERTFYGLGGYGDLVASMALTNRPEVVLGRELAAGASLVQAQERAELRIEAVELVPKIAHFAKRRGVSCTIFSTLADILSGEASPQDAIAALFSSAN